MRFLITGATGYIGGALARRLVSEGHEVRALVRATSRLGDLEALGVDCLVGDILDRDSLQGPMERVDWVVHCAAELDLERPVAQMRRTNVEGSDNVAAAALAAAVPRFLMLSSVAAFGGSPKDRTPATDPPEVQHPLPTSYCITKHEGERAIDEWEARGLAVNVVYPSLVYGPPGKKRGANVILRDVVLGRMPVMAGADRRVSWIYLDDLVDGLVRVIERAEPGRRYLMTGEARVLGEVVAEIAALAGARPPRVNLPVGLLKLLAPLVKRIYALRGYRAPLSPQIVRSIERNWWFDDSRTREELDWNPRGLAEGLPPAIEFLRA